MRITRRSRLIAAAATGLALMLATPLGASAHDFLVSSTPADGANLTELPEVFSVTANGDLLDLAGDGTGFGILVTDAAGRYYGDGCVTVTGPTLATTAALGEAGPYTLTWQLISGDGHPTSGTLSFTWAPTSAEASSTGSATVPVCGETVIEPLLPTASPTSSPTSSPTGDSTGESTAEPAPGGAEEPPATASSTVPWVIGAGSLAAIAAIIALVALQRRKTSQGPADGA